MPSIRIALADHNFAPFNGLVERKIAYWNDDFIDWLLVDWSRVVAHRDATPAVRAVIGIPYRGRTRNRI